MHATVFITLFGSLKVSLLAVNPRYPKALPDDNRELEPPDPMPNSEVKRFIADGSVALRHVRVGHRQAFNTGPVDKTTGLFFEQNLPFVNYGRVDAQCVNSLAIKHKNRWAVVEYAYSLFGILDLQGYG